MAVAVVTGDAPPVGGLSPNGAGIRAWGLAQALRALGREAVLVFPSERLPGGRVPRDAEGAAAFPREKIARLPARWAKGEKLVDFVGDASPVEAVIYQHWPMLGEAKPSDLPVAVDLAGPHLLERWYWGAHPFPGSVREKIGALAKADFAAIGSRWQAAWFAPFLAAAWGSGGDFLSELSSLAKQGKKGRRLGFADFHFDKAVLKAKPWPYKAVERPVIVYCGAFLPWQNPAWAIRETLAFLDRIKRGELLLIGSPLPGVDAGEELEALLREIDLHPRARRIGRTPLEYVASLAKGADAALDLMEPNPERVLATPTRAAMYRGLGVPAIYNDYSEWSGRFDEGAFGTGWNLPWGDSAALARALEEASGRAVPDSLPSSPSEFYQDQARVAADSLAEWLLRVERGSDSARRDIAKPEEKTLGLETARQIAEEAADLFELPDNAREAIREGLGLVLNERRPAAWEKSAASAGADPRGSLAKRALKRIGGPVVAPAAALAAFGAAFALPWPKKKA